MIETVKNAIVRELFLHLVDYIGRHSAVFPDRAWRALSRMPDAEVQLLAERCLRYVHIDMYSIEREINRTHQRTFIRELMRAGASNRLVREIFGLSPRDLTRLRTEAGVNVKEGQKRRKLKPEEERKLVDHHQSFPISNPSSLDRATWSLEASRELNLPLMLIYRHTFVLHPS